MCPQSLVAIRDREKYSEYFSGWNIVPGNGMCTIFVTISTHTSYFQHSSIARIKGRNGVDIKYLKNDLFPPLLAFYNPTYSVL